MSDSPAPQSGVTNTNEKSGKVEETAASDHNIALLSMPAPICTRNSNHSLSGKRREPYSGAAGPSLFPMPTDHDQNRGSSTLQATHKIKKKRKKRASNNLEDQAPNTNSCFVCFKSGEHHYAVQIHLAWPGRWVYRKDLGGKDDLVKIWPEFEFEGSEVEVMQAIKDAIYKQKGRWKRWLWCYEVRSAEEVKV